MVRTTNWVAGSRDRTTTLVKGVPLFVSSSIRSRNLQKYFWICVFCPYLGVVKDRLSSGWFSVQTLKNFREIIGQFFFFFLIWSIISFPYQGILRKKIPLNTTRKYHFLTSQIAQNFIVKIKPFKSKTIHIRYICTYIIYTLHGIENTL